MTKEILETVELLSNRTLEALKSLTERIEKNGLAIVELYVKMSDTKSKLNDRLDNIENLIGSFEVFFLKDEYLSIIHKSLQIAKYHDKTIDDEIRLINSIQKKIEKYIHKKGIVFNPIYDGLFK